MSQPWRLFEPVTHTLRDVEDADADEKIGLEAATHITKHYGGVDVIGSYAFIVKDWWEHYNSGVVCLVWEEGEWEWSYDATFRDKIPALTRYLDSQGLYAEAINSFAIALCKG